jgi:hypothetical protein
MTGLDPVIHAAASAELGILHLRHPVDARIKSGMTI